MWQLRFSTFGQSKCSHILFSAWLDDHQPFASSRILSLTLGSPKLNTCKYHQNCTFYPSKIQVKSITSHLRWGAFPPVLIHAILRMRFGGRSSHNAGTTPLLTPPLCLVPPTNDDKLSRAAANKMRPLIHVPNGLKLCTSILWSIWVVNLALRYRSFKFCQMMAEFTQGKWAGMGKLLILTNRHQ